MPFAFKMEESVTACKALTILGEENNSRLTEAEIHCDDL